MGYTTYHEGNGHEWTEHHSTRYELPKTRNIHVSTKEENAELNRYYAAQERALDDEAKNRRFGKKVRSYAASIRAIMEKSGINTMKIPNFLHLEDEALHIRWPAPPAKEETGIEPEMFYRFFENDFGLGFYKLYNEYKDPADPPLPWL